MRSAATGIDRVAIVDWDVHHGNGTQDDLLGRPSVLFVSCTRTPSTRRHAAPSATAARRGGGGDGQRPAPGRHRRRRLRLAFERVVEPAPRAFGPDLLLVSAGQDPAASDPLGRMSVTTEGFRDLTERAMALAGELCDGRLVVVLEGGYSLEQLPFCNLAIAERLAGLEPSFSEDPLELDIPRRPARSERDAIERAAAFHAR